MATTRYDELYGTYFAEYFEEARGLFERLCSTSRPITDEELSWILMTLPIRMFEVSEGISRINTISAVQNLSNKAMMHELTRESAEKTETKRKADAEHKMIERLVEYQVYKGVSERVASEVAMCKELIMGAKKVWDGRRKGETSAIVENEYVPIYARDIESETT